MSPTDHLQRVEAGPGSPARSSIQVQRLVGAAARDKERAWTVLVQEFNQLVSEVARAHGLDDADTTEVVQATWMRMFTYVLDRHTPGRLGAWLANAARRECLRILWASDEESDEAPWLAAVMPTAPADADPRPAASDRLLATFLFTDIVGSTERAVELGDRRWHELLDAHDTAVRRELVRWGGREMKTTGDGFLATFDCPARAVSCASAIADAVEPLGIQVRAGVHTGECELVNEELAGIAVHIAARVASLAGAHEVLVSSTVKDLVRGSGLCFADRGAHTLKGVPDQWCLYALQR
jgi:class 3 adenylate cyclase